MLRLARRAAGRVRRQIRKHLFPPPPPPTSPWADEGFAIRRIAELRPDVVLDVGANEGQFVLKLRAKGYKGRVISFEPLGAPFAALSQRAAADPAWECHRFALGEAAATLSMHVSAFSVSSSLLPIGKLHTDLMPQTKEVGLEEVKVRRFDEWEGAAALAGKRLFLKLDVQGYELPAIRGMGRYLSAVEGALVEVNFGSLFDGQSKYHDVMRALDEAQLGLVGLTAVNMHPTTSDFLWADAMFVRRADRARA